MSSSENKTEVVVDSDRTIKLSNQDGCELYPRV